VDLLPIENRPEFKPPVQFFKVQVDILWKSGTKERSTRIDSYKTIRQEEDEKKS
jgi:hypothetical protein